LLLKNYDKLLVRSSHFTPIPVVSFILLFLDGGVREGAHTIWEVVGSHGIVEERREGLTKTLEGEGKEGVSLRSSIVTSLQTSSSLYLHFSLLQGCSPLKRDLVSYIK